jgi:hypothetical protein
VEGGGGEGKEGFDLGASIAHGPTIAVVDIVSMAIAAPGRVGPNRSKSWMAWPVANDAG